MRAVVTGPYSVRLACVRPVRTPRLRVQNAWNNALRAETPKDTPVHHCTPPRTGPHGVTSLPRFPVFAIAAGDAGGAVALVTATAATSTQLSTLPTVCVTQLVLWRQARTACASAGYSLNQATLHGSCGSTTTSTSTGAPTPLSFLFQRDLWRYACPARKKTEGKGEAPAFGRVASAAVSAVAPAATQSPSTALAAVSATTAFPSPPSSSLSPADCAAAGARGSAVLGGGESERGHLHVCRRHYGTTAARAGCDDVPSASADPQASENTRHLNDGAKQDDGDDGGRSSADDGGDMTLPPPSFQEVYTALCALRLVDGDGCPVQSWTSAELKQAYRTLAKQLHPDLAGRDSTTEMELVNTAYACLTAVSAEVMANFSVWLESGGAAEMRGRQAPAPRWALGDLAQLMLVGWCTTMSGLAVYAGWRVLHDPASSAQGSAAVAGGGRGGGGSTTGRSFFSGTSASSSRAGRGASAARLTLPRAGAAMSNAAAVQYGVVSSGGAFVFSSGLSWCSAQFVRSTVSRYALAVALTLAACVNTVMLQRVLTRFLTGTS